MYQLRILYGLCCCSSYLLFSQLFQKILNSFDTNVYNFSLMSLVDLVLKNGLMIDYKFPLLVIIYKYCNITGVGYCDNNLNHNLQ